MVRQFARPISIVLFLFGCLSGFARPLEIELNEVDEEVDGMRSHYLELTGTDFKGKRFPGGNWVLAEDAPGQASIRFFHRYQPELFMDFAVFADTDLMGDYSESSLRNYVLELKKNCIREGVELSGARAAKAAVGSVPFMGSGYWKISYSVVDSRSGQVRESVVEFVSVDEKNRNFRLRFSGPERLVEQFESSFADEAGRFTLQ